MLDHGFPNPLKAHSGGNRVNVRAARRELPININRRKVADRTTAEKAQNEKVGERQATERRHPSGVI
jgi:hypothetical protein